MNKHREKCDHLKQIRKSVADSLGVDLKQTVCTFEGECSGTCPKCQQEEKKLSKALLAGTAVAASAAIMLTGCTNDSFELEGATSLPPWEDEMIDGGMTEPELEIEQPVLEGDIAIIDEDMNDSAE